MMTILPGLFFIFHAVHVMLKVFKHKQSALAKCFSNKAKPLVDNDNFVIDLGLLLGY